MEKITRKDILEKAINNWYCSSDHCDCVLGLCALFTKVIRDITNDHGVDFVRLKRRDKQKIFPKFRRIYATLFFHASLSNLYYWWDIGVWEEDGRIGFLRWLYNQYKDDTEDISNLIIKPSLRFE